jgi:hypothetical protein
MSQFGCILCSNLEKFIKNSRVSSLLQLEEGSHFIYRGRGGGICETQKLLSSELIEEPSKYLITELIFIEAFGELAVSLLS